MPCLRETCRETQKDDAERSSITISINKTFRYTRKLSRNDVQLTGIRKSRRIQQKVAKNNQRRVEGKDFSHLDAKPPARARYVSNDAKALSNAMNHSMPA